MKCKATIRGIPHMPTVTEVNVRTGPGTNNALAFKMAVGLTGLKVLDVQPDADGGNRNGKVYQWFQLVFPDGTTGWIRDDLLEIEGNCNKFGYATYPTRTFAFDLRRGDVPAALTPAPIAPAPVTPTPVAPAPVTPAPVPVSPAPVAPAVLAIDNIDRIKRAAFAVTAAFEGHGYSAYQNYDRGIISYGRFQFALNGGLTRVVTAYVNSSHSPIAQELRNYLPRIQAVDESLRHDTRLRDLLVGAASEREMQMAQDQAATENYWQPMMDLSATPRGLGSPLGLAMLFDIAIQYGVRHSLLGMAEEDLKVPPRSRVGTNGITEQQLIAQVAERRRRGLYAQAERDNLPGLKPRADFWVNLINLGDWGLQGDVQGNVNVNGKIIQVKNP